MPEIPFGADKIKMSLAASLSYPKICLPAPTISPFDKAIGIKSTRLHGNTVCKSSNFQGKMPPILDLPNIAAILGAAQAYGVSIELKTWGPFFKVLAKSTGNEELGRAEGFVTTWTEGKILHLESIRMSKAAAKMDRPVFGISLFIGAVAIRHGLEQGCIKAELLAIKDDNGYHPKLVKYYTRMGFKKVYDVTGDSIQDLPDMVMWGGIGTRMDASIKDLLVKWRSFLLLK